MNELEIIQVKISNLLTKAIELHDSIGNGFDTINEEIKLKQVNTSLINANKTLMELSDLYKDMRNDLIVYEYLAGHDIFTIMNDFKITKATIMKILNYAGIKHNLRKK